MFSMNPARLQGRAVDAEEWLLESLFACCSSSDRGAECRPDTKVAPSATAPPATSRSVGVPLNRALAKPVTPRARSTATMVSGTRTAAGADNVFLAEAQLG